MCQYIKDLFIFNVLHFSWDNGECEKLSPWDMEPIDEQSKYQ